MDDLITLLAAFGIGLAVITAGAVVVSLIAPALEVMR